MGFVSTLIINNDLLSDIKDDKDFGNKVYHAVLSLTGRNKEIPIHSGCGNAATAVDCHHSSYGIPIIVGGRSFFSKIDNVYVPEGSKDQEMDLLKGLAEKHGMSLRKKPAKKAKK